MKKFLIVAICAVFLFFGLLLMNAAIIRLFRGKETGDQSPREGR